MWVVFSMVAVVWALFVPLNGAGCKQISDISLALISCTSTPFLPPNLDIQEINRCSLDKYSTSYNCWFIIAVEGVRSDTLYSTCSSVGMLVSKYLLHYRCHVHFHYRVCGCGMCVHFCDGNAFHAIAQ